MQTEEETNLQNRQNAHTAIRTNTAAPPSTKPLSMTQLMFNRLAEMHHDLESCHRKVAQLEQSLKATRTLVITFFAMNVALLIVVSLLMAFLLGRLPS